MMPITRWLALALLLFCSPLLAQDNEGESSQQAPSAPPSAIASPEATWATLNKAIGRLRGGEETAIEDALSTLDLSAINSIVRRERGTELVWNLAELIAIEGQPFNTKAATDKTKEVILYRFDRGNVRLSNMSDGSWLVAADSLKVLPQVLDDLQKEGNTVDDALIDYQPLSLRIKRAIPNSLRSTTVLLEHWQWLGIVLVVIIGVFVDKLASFLLAGVVRQWRSRAKARAYAEIASDLLRPFALMSMAAVWWMGINLLSLPDATFAALLLAAKVLAALSGVWGIYRLVDLVGAYLKDKAIETESNLDDILVPLFVKSAKILVAVMGIIFIADTLQMNVAGLVAGLGLGGLAFALAAKDVVENLFGSITVLLDRPFGVGDWVVIGSVEGTVEAMGFRSTRIRTFYNSLITMPNSAMITAHVDNMGARQYRRYKAKLGLTYDTPPEKIEAFCEGVREIVRLHPDMRKDYYHVYFNDYGAVSLDVLVYVFFKVPDWGAELKARHEFLLAVLRLADSLGVEFAFPTQTLFMRNEEGWQDPEGLVDPALEAGRNAAKAAMENLGK